MVYMYSGGIGSMRVKVTLNRMRLQLCGVCFKTHTLHAKCRHGKDIVSPPDSGDGVVRFVLYDLTKPQAPSCLKDIGQVEDLSIPPKCRLGFSQVLKGALDKVICKPDDISCWVSLLFLPLCLLKTFFLGSNLECKSAIKRQRQEESIGNAIRSWSVPGLDLSEQNIKKCKRKICDGHYTAAVRALFSSSVVPYNHATLEDLKTKHPFKPAPSLVSGGGEAVLHIVNRLIKGHGDDVGLLMLPVDFKNAFNLVDQDVMLLEAWYMDHGTIIRDTLIVGKVLKLIIEDGPRCGLHLKVDKTEGELLLLRACAGISKLYFAMRTCSPQVFEMAECSFDVALHSALERIVTASGPDYGSAFNDALCVFNTKMETNLLSNTSKIATPKLMKKLEDIYFTRVTQTTESIFSLSSPQMALWQSKIEDHTSDWLRVVSNSGLGQTMNWSSPLTHTWMVDFIPGSAVVDVAHRKRVKYEAKRVPFEQRNNPPQHPRIVYPPILDINYFRCFLDILQNHDPMDDEPMWAADHVVAPPLGSTITVPETANEFAIKAGGIFLYKTLNQAYQLLEDKVLLKLDWAKIQKTKSSLKKIVAFAAEDFQSCSKQSNLDDDDISMSREEEAKFMQTFRRTHFYNDYRDRDSNRGTFMYLKNKLETTTKNHQASIQNLEAKFDRLADKQSGRPSGSLPNNTQSNPKGSSSKPYQPPQARNKHVNAIFTWSDGTERMIFHIDSAMKHSYSNDDTCFSIDVINEILEEYFVALLDEAMTVDENSESESDTEEPPFEKITFNTDYKIKTSLEEPPTDLELKPLPDNMEYVFLKAPSFLPVIISSQLFVQNKNRKGTENVAADNISRTENEQTSDNNEVDDNFPGKTLMEINTEDEP
nr:putative reverse transcriptase domain-containing protein [Tanacetum cinerariifolium]